jgi:hypothetical protein
MSRLFFETVFSDIVNAQGEAVVAAQHPEAPLGIKAAFSPLGIMIETAVSSSIKLKAFPACAGTRLFMRVCMAQW